MEWALIAAAAAFVVYFFFLRRRPSKEGKASAPVAAPTSIPQGTAISLAVPSLPRDFEEAIASALREGQDPGAVAPPPGYHAHHIGVSGESFDNPNGTSRQTIIADTPPGTTVYLVPEPDNPHDGDAIRVFVAKGGPVTAQVGYLPRGHFDIVTDVRHGNIAAWFASKDKAPNGAWGAVLYLVRRAS